MTDPSHPSDDPGARAAGELTRLNGRVASMRSVLIRLLQDVVQAESRLDSSQSMQLLQANERLVVTAMRAQTDADTAALALDEASRSAGLDALTDLPNRALLLDRFAHAIASAKRRGTRVALLFLDLDSFKQINDTFGHAVGDEALKVVARCLASSVRETDTVSRHGGDEFVILLPEVSRPADAVQVAEKVIESLRTPTRIDGHEIVLSASIGISLYPDDGVDANMLIDRADAAMYLAKRHELGRYVFHGERPSSDESLRSPPPRSPQQRLAHHERTIVDHERRHALLQEANEQLVLAALGAQELQAASDRIRMRQADFLAVVADELSNPHSPIRVATAMLGRVSQDEPLLPRARAIIDREVEQLSRMANELLDPTRMGNGELTLDPRIVDMAALVAESVRIRQPEMDSRHQTFTIDMPPGPLEIVGDPERLAQMLGNLLINAITYAQEAGTIRLSVEVEPGNLVVTVSDTGIGITPEALPTIFEPFARDTHAMGFRGVGLGLGLTAVREIVVAHGGSVAAFSAGRGLGSRFVVTLPAITAAGRS